MLVAMGLAGCEDPPDLPEMRNGAHLKPYEENAFFNDGTSARPLVEGVVARDPHAAASPLYNKDHDAALLGEDDAMFRGVDEQGQPVRGIPLALTEATLARGQRLFTIYCSVCHGPAGEGDGMIPRRGFTKPPSYHTTQLRSQPDGHFFQVITNGFGRMPSMAFQVEPQDRWAIVAYIRALQLSQHATMDQVPAPLKSAVESGVATRPAGERAAPTEEGGHQ